MKDNIQKILTYSSSQVFVLFAGLLISSIWARYATQAEYGAYQLLISFVSIAGIFSLPGLSISMQLSSAKEKEGNLKKALKIKMKYAILGSLFLFSIGMYYYVKNSSSFVYYLFFIASIFYPLYPLNSLWENWLTGKKEINKMSLYFILNSTITIVLMSISLIYLSSVKFFVISYFLFIGIFNFMIIYSIIKNSNNIVDDDILEYGYKYSGVAIISMFASFDRFIIAENISIADVAIYGVAIMFATKIRLLFTILNKLIAPQILKTDSIKEGWDYIKTKFFYIIIFFSFIAIGGFLYVDKVILFIYTDKYIESVQYAKWLIFIIALTMPIAYLNYILKVHKKLKYSYIMEFINSIGKLILFFIFIPIYNLWGVVYGIIFINVFVSLYTLVVFVFYYKQEKKVLL